MDFAAYAAAISEGQCPRGHGALEVRDELGWCAGCRLGYRVRVSTPADSWMGPIIVDEVVILEASVPVGELAVDTVRLTRGDPSSSIPLRVPERVLPSASIE